MSYEHRIIIAERHVSEGEKPYIFSFELARFDLGWMIDGENFKRVFSAPIDFDIFVNNEDQNVVYPAEYWREDMYGEHCKFATVDAVLDYLSATADSNRRVKLFLACLRQLKAFESDYGQICLVHYGY